MDRIKQTVSEKYKELILKAITYHFPQAKVVLFGSRARNTHKPGSDIDVAIDVGHAIKLHEMARVRATLENLPISLEIDIVDMQNIPVELQAIIKAEGIVI